MPKKSVPVNRCIDHGELLNICQKTHLVCEWPDCDGYTEPDISVKEKKVAEPKQKPNMNLHNTGATVPERPPKKQYSGTYTLVDAILEESKKMGVPCVVMEKTDDKQTAPDWF